MKYKVGDRVLIKSFEWYNENKDINGNVHCGDKVFDDYMSVFCGSVVTIGGVYPYNGYDIREDLQCRTWTDEMIECKVEEESEKKLSDESWRYKNIFDHSQYPQSFECPEGYILKDENGNVINAQKIVLEKKKKEYPKTYEECINELDINEVVAACGWKKEIKALQTLLVCRDAYWKIAGEEMGLGKPWEPDYNNRGEKKFSIWVDFGEIKLGGAFTTTQMVLSFPTEEMRDAFYENFKELIESAKELL